MTRALAAGASTSPRPWRSRWWLGGETVPEIAADVGKPAERIYKRVSRLLEKLDPERGPDRKAP